MDHDSQQPVQRSESVPANAAEPVSPIPDALDPNCWSHILALPQTLDVHITTPTQCPVLEHSAYTGAEGTRGVFTPRRHKRRPTVLWLQVQVSQGRNQDWNVQIEKDLHRTFPGHPVMDRSGRRSLRRILAAYACRNSSVGYCQVRLDWSDAPSPPRLQPE